MSPSPANYFFVETGFHYVGQESLELPTSGDLLALALQSAGITGVSPYTQPQSNPNEMILNISKQYQKISYFSQMTQLLGSLMQEDHWKPRIQDHSGQQSKILISKKKKFKN